MMDRKKEEKIAKEFSGYGQAYVKAEYRGGGDNTLLVSGHIMTILLVAERIISRVADTNGQSFINAWMAVRDIHQNMDGKTQVVTNGVVTPYSESEDE